MKKATVYFSRPLILLAMLMLCGCSSESKFIRSPTVQTRPEETVVLLHGLIRTSTSMNRIARRLESEGYRVYNISYPARKLSIDKIVDQVHEKLKICCQVSTGKVHFVTHSMGGIIVRAYTEKYAPDNLGRVVMLGPPNKGSELADAFGNSEFFGYVFGPPIRELGTNAQSTPNRLGEVDFELGIITGNRSWNPISSLIIPGPDDGTVSTASAQLESMQDFMIVPHTHTFIMNDKQVIDEIIHFLRQGQFSTPAPE